MGRPIQDVDISTVPEEPCQQHTAVFSRSNQSSRTASGNVGSIAARTATTQGGDARQQQRVWEGEMNELKM
ncbi:hypothetical protein EJ04DRAFT_508200 [Polyplosphaeria fusca]|uniref:Uncharacterized protein n=1 Tax=Polyplosphaeria fusca TaxID=682080 RepID=A0A9P4V836_9PLEO|nr:hypothetical protein EJ04DRAFT_508200 [Polyplosphaeria fusca]